MDDNLLHLGLVDEDDILLDMAALSLALLDHPETDVQPYEALLDALATHLDAVGGYAATARDQAGALAQVLHKDFGFTGDRHTYDDPANADMIRVLDRRRGLPISLSILYVAAARRVGWPANVLNVPGHVLVLVGENTTPVIIDPFSEGEMVSGEQLAALLASSDSDPPAANCHIATMSNRAILVRLLLNQASRAEQAGKGRRALELYSRMTALAPSYAHAWWERARLELVDHDVEAARKSLTSMLEVTREPDIRQKVVDTLGALTAS
jgi:regulator of sirC expression with transglutaminase-like and TPR domain